MSVVTSEDGFAFKNNFQTTAGYEASVVRWSYEIFVSDTIFTIGSETLSAADLTMSSGVSIKPPDDATCPKIYFVHAYTAVLQGFNSYDCLVTEESVTTVSE